MNSSLRNMLDEGGAFQGYAYAYPHKTAYRPLNPPRELREVWEREDRSALFLYAHVPFCEMRCGFCNLFTMTHPQGDLVTQYLDAFERQAEAVSAALGEKARCSRLALGGGTPTFLSTPELARLLEILNRTFAGVSAGIPKAIEVSPATTTAEKLEFLKSAGFTRVSIGIQSFIESEVRALGRLQAPRVVRAALALLAQARFRCLNLDLIYGIDGQTVDSWRDSITQALEFAPEELYLYPLYVRPLTGLGRGKPHIGDTRLELYRAGRDLLLSKGYRQISMRLFRKRSYQPPEGPVYCCQEDGMVGLGAGARSYTSNLHYSTEYAVGRAGVLDIISDYNQRTPAHLAQVDYGCELSLEEQKRRYVLKSLLRAGGLSFADYQRFFASDPLLDLPQLNELIDDHLALHESETLQLTLEGMELSDVIGPWLWSAPVRQRMAEYALR